MHRILIIIASAMLAACGTLDGKIDNRVACTVAKDKLFVVSEYGPVGVASKISDKDRDVICK